MGRLPSTIYLEVERKFAGLKCYPLRCNSGSPRFLSSSEPSYHKFHDTYYDFEARLLKAGIWLRQRDGKWQMKIRRGGTYTNSQFEERVKSLTGLDRGASQSVGLSRLASFITFRQSWLADNEFNIVLNQTDFGHTVGEVELEIPTRVKDEDNARKIMVMMDQKIADFLQRYEWAFSSDVPIGKLSAYFERQSREGS